MASSSSSQDARPDCCVRPEDSLRAVMRSIDRGLQGIALVLDEGGRLLGAITDGDIRRAILQGIDLDSTAGGLLERPDATPLGPPVTARRGTGPAELLALMREHVIRQVPLLDDQDRLVGLATMDGLLPAQEMPLQAVIMAGGQGQRLRPITENLPKPMLPVGDRPLLEHIIGHLREAGIRRVNVTTHYLPEKIIDYFGNGDGFGIDLEYVTEDKPLGTAGSLGLISPPEETMLVINGDILTRVDCRAMLAYHREQDALITVGVRKFEMSVPYGVVEAEGGFVTRLEEKPSLSFFVNAGIYLLEPPAFGYLRAGQALDMTDLIQMALAEGERVASFPIHEYWLDIGRHDDYLRAQEDHKNGRLEK